MWTNAETTIPELLRTHYSWTNNGDVHGPVSYDRWENNWKFPIDMKRKMYGAMRRLVGGRTDGFGFDTYEDISDGLGAEPEAPPSVPRGPASWRANLCFGGHSQ